MSGIIRKKEPGEAWETVVDTGGGSGTGLPPQWTVDDSTGEVTGTNTGNGVPLELTASPDGDRQALKVNYDNGDPALTIYGDGVEAGLTAWGRDGDVDIPAGTVTSIFGGNGLGDGNGGDVEIQAGNAGDDATAAGGVQIRSGDASNGPGAEGGSVLITAGEGESGAGVGGSIILQSGQGNTNGIVALIGGGGGAIVTVDESKLSFFDEPVSFRQTITGALSTVTDADAKDVLTSIIAALTAYGLVDDGTT